MPLITWDESYSVGNAACDDDHKKIADLLDQFYEAEQAGNANDVLAEILEQVLEYTDYHFKREEDLLEAQNYHRIDEQKVEHKLLKDMLLALRRRLDQGKGANRIATDTREFLLTWWMGHILEEDMKYKTILSGC